MDRTTKSAIVLGGMCSLLGAGFALAHQRAPASDAPRCTLSVPHSEIDPMVFPTKSGSEALDAAIIGNADDRVIQRVISEQGGVSVAHGTPCSTIEAGATYSRVLVIGGPMGGKPVWAPSQHTRGQ